MAAFLAALGGMIAVPVHAQEHGEREFQECTDCPVMVGIPAGRFVMGSPASEPGRFDNEGPQHVVSVKAFALGKFDVTSDQFRNFLQTTRYQPAPCNHILNLGWRVLDDGRAVAPDEAEPLRWPAVCLDWRDADAYIAWLNTRVKAQRPQLAKRAGPYRLPSEAEWEYAARGGTTTSRWWGNAIGVGNANCNGCGSRWDNRDLSTVDNLRPNPFGLYGVLGNAWQWTADCWHKSYVGAPTNGAAWTEKDCSKYVLRGGSWDNVPIFIRSAARSGSLADGGEYDYSSLASFRVARDLP
jgi:formylglycine-generating enzyme required for sulfatase activity